MPKPIVCISAALCQFCEAFRSCFSKRQWKYFVIVLLGLIECEQRRTLSGLLANIGEQVGLCGLSRFFNRWDWRMEEVARIWLGRFHLQLQSEVEAEHQHQEAEREKRRGRPKKTVVTGYLIFDDSVHVKPRGRKMQGLGQHYSSAEQRVVTGHSLLSGLYMLLGRRCPLQPRLYRQQSVCKEEHTPFQSKIDLVLQEIGQFEPVEGTQTHVLIDSWFHCKAVRKAAQGRGWEVSGGLKSNRKMRLIDPDGTRCWMTLAEYAAKLQPADWQEAIWPSREGGQKVYVHSLRTHIRKLGPVRLLITCQEVKLPLLGLHSVGHRCPVCHRHPGNSLEYRSLLRRCQGLVGFRPLSAYDRRSHFTFLDTDHVLSLLLGRTTCCPCSLGYLGRCAPCDPARAST